MNILLVKPYYPYPYNRGDYTYNRVWPPLALANCAAMLEKAGWRVNIFDAHAQRIKPNKISNYICGYDKIFITSSALDKWQCPNVNLEPFLETARYVTEVSDQLYIIGYHGSVEPENILALTQAKAVIIGEPENAVVDICQNNDLSTIKGICYRRGKQNILSSPREQLDLRGLPTPAFHLLDFRKYFYEILGNNLCLFELSRGCKFNCIFCNRVMYGDGLRVKSKDQIFAEISLAVESYAVKTGYFIDLDFLANRDLVRELCEYLIKKQYRFKWACQTRPDLLEIELLKKMKAAGCQIIHIGVETGLQESLTYLNKGITAERIERAVNLCRKAEIRIFAFLLFGLPQETSEDRERNLEFVKKLNVDFVSFHKMHSYKGSQIYKDHPELNGDVDRFIRWAFLSYYLRLGYLSRLVPLKFLSCIKLLYGRIKNL